MNQTITQTRQCPLCDYEYDVALDACPECSCPHLRAIDTSKLRGAIDRLGEAMDELWGETDVR